MDQSDMWNAYLNIILVRIKYVTNSCNICITKDKFCFLLSSFACVCNFKLEVMYVLKHIDALNLSSSDAGSFLVSQLAF